jgi:predicted permease
MRWIKKSILRFRSLFLPSRVEDELDYEIRFHLEQQIEENLLAGMTPDAARLQALRTMGRIRRIKDECRDRRRVAYVEDLSQDVRYGLRQLARSPGFAIVAVLTLALGIGANTTIFSLTEQVLLRQLPVMRPEELVVLRSPGYKTGHTSSDGDPATSFSYPMYKELRDRGADVAALVACYSLRLSVSGAGQTELVDGELVSGNYFQVLGVGPALGRTLAPEDETAPGANPVAVLSYGYWKRRFGADSSILNQTLAINGTALTVVGVSRQAFTGIQIGQIPDVFRPITMKAQMTPNWDGLGSAKDYWAAILGRLKPGFTAARAEAALLPTYKGILESQAPEMKMPAAEQQRFVDKPIVLEPGAHGRQILQRDMKQPLIILMAMVGLVLLIGCANLAGLLLARSTARQREMALRMSLGAGRKRLIRQLMTESLVLALIGGGLGLVIGLWTLKALIASIPGDFGAVGLRATPNQSILEFAVSISVMTGVLFGLAPALRATRSSLQRAVKEQGSNLSDGLSNVRLRKILIISQIAVTTMLLVGAGLFARSLDSLRRVDLGLKAENLITFSVSPDLNQYKPAQTALLADRLRDRLGSLPVVRSVSAAAIPVLTNSNHGSNITVEGYMAQENEGELDVNQNSVGPSFFSTLGIPLLAGRELNEGDTSSSHKVALVNEVFANRFFAGQSPVGSHFAFGDGKGVHPDIEIVGLVKDSKHSDVRSDVLSFVYLPYSQDKKLGQLTFYIRTDQDAGSVAQVLRQTVAEYDANLPVYNLKTLTNQINEVLFDNRLLTMLSLSFALLASLLAAIGLYGVMAYAVAQRTREVGIRMALGAKRQNVIWLVLKEVLQMMAIGLSAGTVGAFVLGRFIEAELFGVKSKDPQAFILAALLLGVVVLAAGYLPARRAAGVDPMEALRYE